MVLNVFFKGCWTSIFKISLFNSFLFFWFVFRLLFILFIECIMEALFFGIFLKYFSFGIFTNHWDA